MELNSLNRGSINPGFNDLKLLTFRVSVSVRLLVQFRLGSALLTVVSEPAEAVRQLLVHSLERGNALQHHNHKLEEENQRLGQEHQRIAAE